MSGYRIAHRYEETDAGVLRLTESGSFDTEASDNPDWVQAAWDEADEANEVAARGGIKPREGDVLTSEYTERVDARPFGGEPDRPVEDQPQSPEVEGSVAHAAADDADDAEDDADDADGVPPKSGAGSGVQAWARYAQAHDVELTKGMTRDEIVAACEAADVPTE